MSVKYLVALLIASAALAATIWGDTAYALLRYDRAALQHAEAWRLLTGHLVHANLAHCALNLAVLFAILAIFANQITARGLAVAVFILSLTVSGGLYFLSSEIQWYIGLSGVLHGVFALYALSAALTGSRIHALATLALVGKVTYELIAGPGEDIKALIGMNVIVDAHLYGMVGGLVIALVKHIIRTRIANLVGADC